MFDTERETHRALQQYKADLQRSRMQTRRSSAVGSNISVKDFQDRGRPTEQEHGSIERARRGSDGDNARKRKWKRDQELATEFQSGIVGRYEDESNHHANKTGGGAEIDDINPVHRSTTWDLATSQSLSYPTSVFTGSAILREDPKSQETRTVRFNEPSLPTTTDRVPTFARQILNRSNAPGDFVHHRDTFVITKAKRSARNKSQSIVPPRPIVVSLLKYTDHQTYLSLRLVSRSWSRAVDHVRPPHYPAVYKLPTEVIQQIHDCTLAGGIEQPSHAVSSVNDFNNARHSCRAWMAASLDRRLLRSAFLQAGLQTDICASDSEIQDSGEADEDDLSMLWEMSLWLARYCKS